VQQRRAVTCGYHPLLSISKLAGCAAAACWAAQLQVWEAIWLPKGGGGGGLSGGWRGFSLDNNLAFGDTIVFEKQVQQQPDGRTDSLCNALSAPRWCTCARACVRASVCLRASDVWWWCGGGV
jgi:hypothetical protein